MIKSGEEDSIRNIHEGHERRIEMGDGVDSGGWGVYIGLETEWILCETSGDSRGEDNY